MRHLSSLGIGLSLVFGCLLLALVAELYYLLWWKKRIAKRDIEEGHTSPTTELLCFLCKKKPSSLSSAALNPQEICSSIRFTSDSDDAQLRLHSDSGKDHLFKPFEGEETLEAELMRLHNLQGPPRFLFTIKEETKEDLESEDGKSKGGRSRRSSKGRSLSDVVFQVETPFLTPLSSPPFFTPPLTPLDCYSQHGFNPLFESSKADELNRVKSSPPPRFKFLKDAEEKLYRKTLMEEKSRVQSSGGLVDKVPKSTAPLPSPVIAPPLLPQGSEEEDGSFITFIIGKSREKGNQHQHYSSSSQVIPLSSSPSNIKPAHCKLSSYLSTKQ